MATRKSTVAPKLEELRLSDLVAGDPTSLSAHGGYEAQEYSGADLTATDLTGATFSECSFTDITATRLRLPHARLPDTAVRRLDAPTVSAAHAVLRDVLFTDCTIEELHLGEATAERLAFAGTEPESLGVVGAALRNVDLRTLDLRTVPGVTHLGGATMSPLQIQHLAPLLARRQLGITVEE